MSTRSLPRSSRSGTFSTGFSLFRWVCFSTFRSCSGTFLWSCRWGGRSPRLFPPLPPREGRGEPVGGTSQYQFLLAITVLTMTATPFLIDAAPWIARRWGRWGLRRPGGRAARGAGVLRRRPRPGNRGGGVRGRSPGPPGRLADRVGPAPVDHNGAEEQPRY